jgi:hypothetical protein
VFPGVCESVQIFQRVAHGAAEQMKWDESLLAEPSKSPWPKREVDGCGSFSNESGRHRGVRHLGEVSTLGTGTASLRSLSHLCGHDVRAVRLPRRSRTRLCASSEMLPKEWRDPVRPNPDAPWSGSRPLSQAAQPPSRFSPDKRDPGDKGPLARVGSIPPGWRT